MKKYDNEYFHPSQLEPWVEPEKPAKKPKAKAKIKAIRQQPEKASGTPNPEVGYTQSANRVHPTTSALSLAERLRQALLARLAA